MVWMIAGRFSHMVSIHFLCPFSARPYPQFLRSGAVDAALPEDWESEMTLQKPPPPLSLSSSEHPVNVCKAALNLSRISSLSPEDFLFRVRLRVFTLTLGQLAHVFVLAERYFS